MMYRVAAIVGGALALAACTSSSDFMDAFKPAPTLDSVQFESDPPGAEAKVSNGQSCRTPCALALPTTAPLTVTFTLAGHQPATETIEVMQDTGAAPTLKPNPVAVALAAAPPSKPAKKPARKRPVAKKKPAPTTATKPAARKPAAPTPASAPPAAAPPPMPAEPPQQQAPSPWPTAPAPSQQ
jgi:hypothetical protein